MNQKPLKPIPCNAEFLSVVNGSDLLSVIVRGHQFVETAVNAMISEALPAPHEVEIGRLTFGLKVDLAASLRLIQAESRPLYMAVNRLRNSLRTNREQSLAAGRQMTFEIPFPSSSVISLVI